MFDPLPPRGRWPRAIRGQGWRNAGRQLSSTFRRTPYNTAFQASISNSVAAFYRTFDEGLDARLQGSFGAEVIRLCERIVAAAGAEPASPPKPIRTRNVAPLAPPRALVVGGTGFIGKRLVEALIKRGVGVRVMSRSLLAARIALDGLPVDIVPGNHDDPVALDAALRGIDVVYHLAKATGQRWEDYLRDDVEPTRVLAEAVLAHGVKRFVYTGTIDSYDSADARTVIDARTPVDAAHRQPQSLRALQGRVRGAAAAHARRARPAAGDLPARRRRRRGQPARPLGRRHVPLPTRAHSCGATGTTKLPLVLVDDVAEGLALALDAPGIEGKTLAPHRRAALSAREYVRRACRGERDTHRRGADADLALLRARPGEGSREAPDPSSEPARAELPRLGLPGASRALRQQRDPRRARLEAGEHTRRDGQGRHRVRGRSLLSLMDAVTLTDGSAGVA
jgi:nucleoside-diphosphate-sugar epimerase